MEYRFVIVREIAWAAFVAVMTVLLEALIVFDPEAIVSWQTWALGIGAAGVRAAAAAVLAAFTRGFVVRDEPAG